MNNIQIAGVLGGMAVILGAFGAHGLESILESNGRTETFETAVKYHFYHSLAILAVGIWLRFEQQNKLLQRAGVLFTIGILIFSGTLYILSLTGITWLGAITPIGGIFFIIGWVFLIIAGKK